MKNLNVGLDPELNSAKKGVTTIWGKHKKTHQIENIFRCPSGERIARNTVSMGFLNSDSWSFIRLMYIFFSGQNKKKTKCSKYLRLIYIAILTSYVLLRLRVQNRRKKWNFPPNFRNGIIWTAPFPLNIRNGIIWGGAFSKAFRSSEALISVLSKNALLYDNI